MINKIKEIHLRKILYILLSILSAFYIVKECQLIGFCVSIITLISPIFWGYVIAWLLKPITLKINSKLNLIISIVVTYLLIGTLISIIGYFSLPIIIKEIKNFIPDIVDIYNGLPPNIKNNINMSKIGEYLLNCSNNLKNIILNIFYSLFISYFYLISHKEVSHFIGQYIPHKLAKEISINLKSFVRGTLIDTIILFILCLIAFYIFKMPYALLFAIIISLTNIIPYIGPYIGGIPAALVALSVSNNLAITIVITIIILQFIESTFIHPIIMSKSLNISPIFILLGLIIFGYFFGVIGMVLSTPVVSIIKSCYLYFHKKRTKKVLNK